MNQVSWECSERTLTQVELPLESCTTILFLKFCCFHSRSIAVGTLGLLHSHNLTRTLHPSTLKALASKSAPQTCVSIAFNTSTKSASVCVCVWRVR